jgi:hypothetical protein
MAIHAVDSLIGKDVSQRDVSDMFWAYSSEYTIHLDRDPALFVVKIFRQLNIPHDANQILSLAPVNVTDFEVKA